MEQASGQVLGLDAQGNMLFRLVKPVMGIFHHPSSQQESSGSSSMAQVGVTLQELTDTTLVQVHHGQQQVHDVQVHHGQQQVHDVQVHQVHHPGQQAQVQEQMVGSEVMVPHVQSHMQPHMDAHMQVSESGPVQQQRTAEPLEEQEDQQQVTHMPFAEVSSLLDPNMKGSKARKYLISYDEIKRRLQSPEKMSLRSLAAYTRVSRGPASKKSLLESLNVLGLTPSTTTAVSSSFSKLTEGDTKALCADMKDFAQDYVDYGSMAKQLIPQTNTVQHWSKIIETKNHLEDMRRCFRDPLNSAAFHSVTHGLGLGMLDVALDMVSMVIDRQIRILSGAAASDPADPPGPPARRVRRRLRKTRPPGGHGGGATDDNNNDGGGLDSSGDNKLLRASSGGVALGVKTASSKAKGGRGLGGRSRKKAARLGGGTDGTGGSGTASNTATATAAATAAGMTVTSGMAVAASQTTTTVTMNDKVVPVQETAMENSVLTLVSVGYEAISTGLSLNTAQNHSITDT